MKKIPKSYINSRCQIVWDDPSGYINDDISEVKLSECVSEGLLVVLEDEKLILRTSLYTGSQVGDYTIIHPALVKQCKAL
tara:strand:- start:68 stop:307 length:240 start_codon:yes stop_codon:yes gene_type:complete